MAPPIVEGVSTFLDAFKSKAAAIQLPLGFSAGIPYMLSRGTLTAWLALSGVDLKTIGYFALAGLPYNFKFVWAPLLDRYPLPFLSRRRGWMVLTQLLLIAIILALAATDMSEDTALFAGIVVLMNFVAASQDIVADAYRTEVLPEHQRASGAAIFVTGYRLALLTSGGLALILSDHMSWQSVYRLMACTMIIGLVATFLASPPERPPKPPRTLTEALVMPLGEFFRRKGAFVMLVIVASYKIGDAVAGHFLSPFLLTLFTATEVGSVQKIFGMVATIVGSLAGGGLVSRYGLKPCLIAFGVLQAVANGLYAWLAVVGASYPLLVVSIGVDNFFGGLGTAAFVALLMTLCHQKYTATQYALLSSAMSLGGRFIAASGGSVAEEYGWSVFFGITIVAAVPAIVLLWLRPLAEPDPEILEAAAEEAKSG